MKSKRDAVVLVQSKLPDDPQVLKRLNRAAQDVLGYGYAITTQGDGIYQVEKLSTAAMLTGDNGRTYLVDDKSCNCPDFDTARGNLCKHRLAVMILKEMQC